MFRQVLARRVRLETDFAGSVGVAGAATTADADFDVRRNGSSIGTIRFGTGAMAATFIAATETVLEAGDVLSVIAPTTPDATLADIGLALAGTLVG